MPRSAEAIRDELLVLRCQDGEGEAFEELVGRWHGKLTRHAARLCRVPELAADAVQEAWLAILRGLDGLDDPARFRSWALRIVANKVADLVRRRQRQARAEDRVAREVGAGASRSDEGEPDLDLREGLRRLPADQRLILELRYLEELGIAEIARVLDLPDGTVKSRLYHARNRLQLILERQRHG